MLKQFHLEQLAVRGFLGERQREHVWKVCLPGNAKGTLEFGVERDGLFDEKEGRLFVRGFEVTESLQDSSSPRIFVVFLGQELFVDLVQN